jgi:pimeloyl-ACP methyl ester carboxylesterase
METNKQALEQIVQNFSSIDYCTHVPKVHCPVHFVVGRFDPIAPYFHVETMHQLTPKSTLHIIEWAGHNCMDSQPASFNKWFFDKVVE